MTHPKELDLGPLTWVKSEIELALTRAAESLEQAGRTGDNAAPIQFAQTHLHQVRGALSIVGLDGLTQFATALDQLFGAMARGEATADEAHLTLGRRALASIGNYLEELAHGTPDQPLRLLPLYREIAAARGNGDGAAADLFYPDMGARAARRSATPPALPADVRQNRVRSLRVRFQRGLLGWIKAPTMPAGPAAMGEALAELESIEDNPSARSMWWVARAFVETLAQAVQDGEADRLRLLSRIEAQLRRSAGSSQSVPERLMRELLYQVASAPGASPAQLEVRKAWGLDLLMPEPGARVSDLPLAPLLQELRARLAVLKEEWDAFSAGSAAALQSFESRLDEYVEPVHRLGRPALDRLIRGIQQFSQWLRKDPLHFTDSMAIEVATALLLSEAALDRSVPDSGFSAQVDDTIARLEALTRGERLAAAENSPGLEAARRAQERDAVAQLAREITSSLANVEQALDDFFRDPQKRQPLAQLSNPLRQIEGALSLLGETEALDLIHEAGETIARLASEDTPADQAELENLAHRLSALGFFIQSLQHGRASLKHFLDGEAPAPQFTDEQTFETGPDAASTAAERPRAPEAALEAVPPSPSAAPAIPPELTSALAHDEVPEAGEEDHVAAEPVAMPEIAPETRRLVDASDEEIDAELLCIFIEEAHEVLATIAEQLELSRTDPANRDYLTAIRRGFHTLKGSGRMVGLRELGEAAWGLEQTLNRWLQLEWAPTSALHHLVDDAHQQFGAWVVQLESGGPQHKDVEALVREAERLRNSDTPTFETAPAGAGGASSAPATGNDAVPALDFPELPLAESGEVLPYSVTAEHETPAVEDDESAMELAELEEFDLASSAPEADLELAPATTAPAPAEGDFDTIDLEPLLGPIDLELRHEDVSAEADSTAPPSADVTEDTEMLSITALDDAWMPGEDTFALAEAGTPPESIVTGPGEALALAEEPDALGAELEQSAEATLTDELPGVDELALEDDFPLENEIDLSAGFTVTEDFTTPTEPSLSDAIATSDTGDARDEHALSAEAERPQVEEESGAAETEARASAEADRDEAHADFIRVGEVEVSRPLYDLYVAEARHHISTLHQDFGRLAANPTLPPPETSLRAAHTFAGISGTARITPLHLLARALEHAQQRLRDQGGAPSSDELALFRTVVTTLESMLGEVASRSMPLQTPDLIEQLEHVGRRPVEEPVPEPERPATSLAASEAVEEEPLLQLNDEIDEQLLPIFLEEAAELISELHATLRNWRNDPAGTDHAKGTARLLHTLKGSARMAGAMTLGEHVHHLESRLELSSGGDRSAASLVEDLVTGLDITEQMIDSLAAGELAPPPAVREQAPAAAAGPAQAAVTIDAGAADGEATAASGTLRVRTELIDRFVNEAGEIGVARTRIDGELRNLRRSMLDLTENVIRLRNQLREVEIQADVQMQSRMAQAESHHAEFDPLEMDRYTRLQELTRMMAESVNDVTTVQQSLLKNLDGADLALHSQARLSRELQQALMRVRMVPFDSLADRLYRIVRKGAKELGKRANLDLRGGRIEIDRSVLEHMVAPLEHLLRNALAHGIEAPEQRRAANKPEIGQITLTVRQEGNEIAIELADDGAGLNFERIAARARQNGLLAADEVADERRLTNLIFVPGFSTAGALSAVAGRGVGMDVVKAETAAAGGRIDVSSSPDTGTVFRIHLPLTLAVTQALLVRAGGRHYAIPSSMVAQVMELKPAALEHLRTSGGTEWQNEHYAYRYLPRLLGDRHTQPEIQRYNWVLLLRAGAQTLALHVDALRGNQEIIVKNAGPQLTRTVGMSGATVLGDGEIVLILNPVALASRGLGGGEAEDEDAGDTREAESVSAPARIPTVMVVDDSLTVRKITGRLLEREGYRVITAKDGVDALEMLIETLPDVVLSDIEMPRMDGFDLVRNIRADARTKALPVIMITSRLAEKHRNYAMEVGADHYLGKPYQEDELLGLIGGYVGRD